MPRPASTRFPENFGERLRELRHAAGFSQTELAARAKVSLSLVFKLEQGRSKWPSLDTVVALADALGRRLDDFHPIPERRPKR